MSCLRSSDSEPEENLHDALHGALRTFMQPIVDLRQKTVMGLEFLNRPHYGTADELFASAAKHGKACDLDILCYGNNIETINQLEIDENLKLFFNLQPESIARQIFRNNINLLQLRKQIVIEITEAQEYATAKLAAAVPAWKDAGFALAVDDISTGYNRLLNISDLAPDYIKIDRKLVANCEQLPRRRAVITSVISLARELGAGLIAEGVETEAELNCLKSLGVTCAQGFYFFRPFEKENGGALSWLSAKKKTVIVKAD